MFVQGCSRASRRLLFGYNSPSGCRNMLARMWVVWATLHGWWEGGWGGGTMPYVRLLTVL